MIHITSESDDAEHSEPNRKEKKASTQSSDDDSVTEGIPRASGSSWSLQDCKVSTSNQERTAGSDHSDRETNAKYSDIPQSGSESDKDQNQGGGEPEEDSESEDGSYKPPDSEPSDIDIPVSEQGDSDSSYEVHLPITAAQLLDEYQSDDSDDSYHP